jgi:hypothetical protein
LLTLAPLVPTAPIRATANNFSSVNPAFLPTAELMSTQNGQPTRAAVRTFPN